MQNSAEKKFAIFRAGDAGPLGGSGIMTMEPFSEKLTAPILAAKEAGYDHGAQSRVIFAGFGLSIVLVWFKRAFPLPLHSHDADCFYYILGGSLRLGTESLGLGDGFFVPATVPYTYTAGDEGVELLEIRPTDLFDYRDRSSVAFWNKAVKTVADNQDVWQNAGRPFLDKGPPEKD